MSLILSEGSLLRCGVPASDGSQELDLAQSCGGRWNNQSVFLAASAAFAVKLLHSQPNGGADLSMSWTEARTAFPRCTTVDLRSLNNYFIKSHCVLRPDWLRPCQSVMCLLFRM